MAKPSFLADSDSLYFTSPEFRAVLPDTVFHGFFGRQGGVSLGVFDSLNCGPGSDDNIGSVMKNRAIVAEEAGVDSQNLLSLHQVHGDQCIQVEAVWGVDERPEGDGFVTDRPGIALGVLTADCAPVLFYGVKAGGEPVIGAAHAGWGGAFKGVLGSTVEGMVKLGAQQESITACIGPCIAKASYEVEVSFANQFLEEDDENERFFSAARSDGHLMFDLAGYCAFKLFKAGVKRVFIKDLDTYFNEADFYSYRRATHREEKCYGRQISVISIAG